MNHLQEIQLHNGKEVSLHFDNLPICIVLIDEDLKNAYLNNCALEFFLGKNVTLNGKIKNKDLILNQTLIKLFHFAKRKVAISNQQIVVSKYDSDSVVIECTVKYLEEQKMFFMSFNEIASRDYLNSFSLLIELKYEFLKLKPYMNKYGRDLLDKTLDKVYSDDVSDFIMKKATYNEDIVRLIMDKYPVLSRNELLICSLYAILMSTAEIAVVLGKNTNNIRVATHRILKKLNLKDTKELVSAMRILV